MPHPVPAQPWARGCLFRMADACQPRSKTGRGGTLQVRMLAASKIYMYIHVYIQMNVYVMADVIAISHREYRYLKRKLCTFRRGVPAA